MIMKTSVEQFFVPRLLFYMCNALFNDKCNSPFVICLKIRLHLNDPECGAHHVKSVGGVDSAVAVDVGSRKIDL